MPTNKNAQLRYQILDHCFSDPRRHYTVEALLSELADQLGARVSLRTLRDDIAYMRCDLRAPIAAVPWQERSCCYRYSDPSFTIFRPVLSREELLTLRSTLDMLSRYSLSPGAAWLGEVVAKLSLRLGVTPGGGCVAFDGSERLAGLERLPLVIEATVGRRALSVSYAPHGREARAFVFHPYHVRQYNGRWFLLGREQGREAITTLALDRVTEAAEADAPFVENTLCDFATYFDDIVGVSVPPAGRRETVVVRFTPERWPYVVSKPLHASQREAGERCVAIDVIPTRELEQQLLSFGPDAEVLSPAWYRELVGEKTAAMAEKYSAVREGCTAGGELCARNLTEVQPTPSQPC